MPIDDLTGCTNLYMMFVDTPKHTTLRLEAFTLLSGVVTKGVIL